jgi:signal transduction histidine kinase
MAEREIERSEALTDGSDALQFVRDNIERYQTDVTVALCAAVLLILILVLIALARGRRLRKRVDELSGSVRKLINDEEARYTREILGRTKAKGPD